ncbi:MAG TPA: hypothetical protein VG186_04860 [Solirubrobacteraceae bacterium]|jgi:hypothetical protein|nr:hypothetical protein [Solirubrobacteraceae bacterium]
MSSEAKNGSPQPAANGSPAPAPEPKAAATPDATTANAASPRSTPWPDWLRHIAVSVCSWLSRPRVRLTVTGLILLLVGGVLVTSSVWTLPLVIAGALMVVIAWVGHRLDGRLAVEWGETGAQLEFRAQMRAPEHAHPTLAPAAPAPRALTSAAEPEPEDAEVVEGEAHTVEIEVAELKALIAAAESAEAEVAQAEATAHAARILRVAHGGGRSSDAAG